MRAYSPRRARQQRARRAMLQRSHGPERCQWPGGCVREAVDGHETLTRARGGDPTDPDALLCREHHDWIGRHPAEAQAMGMLRSAPPADKRRRNVYAAAMAPKRPITIRVTGEAEQWVSELQRETGASQSLVLRAMLSIASQHRPAVLDKVKTLKEA